LKRPAKDVQDVCDEGSILETGARDASGVDPASVACKAATPVVSTISLVIGTEVGTLEYMAIFGNRRRKLLLVHSKKEGLFEGFAGSFGGSFHAEVFSSVQYVIEGCLDSGINP